MQRNYVLEPNTLPLSHITNNHRYQNTNFLNIVLTAFCVGINVLNFTKKKYGVHFERWAPIGEEYAMSQIRYSSRAEVNKFLLAYVI